MDIEFKSVITDDGLLYFTKGHLDPIQFGTTVCKAEMIDIADMCEPYFAWLRCNPDGYEYGYLLVDGTPGKQGTFPATVIHRHQAYPYRKYDKMPELRTAFMGKAGLRERKVEGVT